MRRTFLSIVLALVVLGAAAGIALATGSGSSVTRARLERALPVAFANQYVQQAHLLGRTGITPKSLHATAMCDKHGPDVPDVGAGSDWVCLMGWKDPNVPMPPEGYGKFEVNVRNNDCFTSGAPSKLVGFQTITDRSGKTVNNPLFEFDGCFDPSADNTPTGTSYPSVLSVASTVLLVPADRKVGVQVTCGTGAHGCAGTMTVTSGNKLLGTVSYTMKEEQSVNLKVPTALPAGAKDATFAFKPTQGMAPPSPTTLSTS